MMVKEMLLWGRRLARAAAGRDVVHRAEINVPSMRLGSDYGGWVVCTDEITSESVVYSFGIGEDATFDLALISEYGLTVHGFDPTPKAIAWVRSRDLPAAFRFHDIGIADLDGTATFNAPKNPRNASYTTHPAAGDSRYAVEAEVRRLGTIMRQLKHQHVDVLKLDVEGSEYAVLADIVASGLNVRQILVEFHHHFENIPVDATKQAVELLRRHGYQLFHVSPKGEEYCFIRRENV